MKIKVLVGGCFDILHFGHISFLKKAKGLGDQLIVILESDKNVRKLKGELRPIHTQKQRKEMLESLRFVDRVICLPEMKTDKDYERLISKLLPHIIAVTENDPYLGKKKSQAKKTGAKIVIIPKTKAPSTSQIAKLINLE
jgi:rfaE bifunctional protein nucleotidyltransferase chain/domain